MSLVKRWAQDALNLSTNYPSKFVLNDALQVIHHCSSSRYQLHLVPELSILAQVNPDGKVSSVQKQPFSWFYIFLAVGRGGWMVWIFDTFNCGCIGRGLLNNIFGGLRRYKLLATLEFKFFQYYVYVLQLIFGLS